MSVSVPSCAAFMFLGKLLNSHRASGHGVPRICRMGSTTSSLSLLLMGWGMWEMWKCTHGQLVRQHAHIYRSTNERYCTNYDLYNLDN